jgi:hypothetical protein
MAPIVSFAVFSIIAVVKEDETLATSRAFTSLTLIALLTLPVYTLLQKHFPPCGNVLAGRPDPGVL